MYRLANTFYFSNGNIYAMKSKRERPPKIQVCKLHSVVSSTVAAVAVARAHFSFVDANYVRTRSSEEALVRKLRQQEPRG